MGAADMIGGDLGDAGAVLLLGWGALTVCILAVACLQVAVDRIRRKD